MYTEILLVLMAGYLARRYINNKRRAVAVKQRFGEDVQPFSSIPHPPLWPFLGSFIEMNKKGFVGGMHRWLEDRAMNYGTIVRDHILGNDIVIISGVDLIEEVARNEGKYPTKFPLHPWVDYRKRKGLSMGLLTSDGEEWKKLRTPWNHTMLKTSIVYDGIGMLNDVDSDFIDRVLERREENGVLPRLDWELFRWSLESVCSLLCEQRLGCLAENPQTDRFITAVKQMMLATEELTNAPLWLAKIVMRKLYLKHEEAWDIITEQAKSLLENKIAEMKTDIEEGVAPTGFLSHVIASHQLTPDEIYASVSEIMAAAVDTTANTAQLVLYEIAKDARLQQTVYDEICEVTGGKLVTADHLRQMDYMKATIREIQRLYPVGVGANRLTTGDIVVGGYHIPPNTTLVIDAYANGRNAALFEDPMRIKPERWLKVPGKEPINSFSNIVFGFGIRGCIGRKTAETEIQILLARILQKFELTFDDEEPVLCTKGILVTESPIPVRFNRRR